MRFSTTFVALFAIVPALAAPIHYHGDHNAHHTHEERDLEERAPEPEPRRGGAAKALGHFAGSAASHYVSNSKRSSGVIKDGPLEFLGHGHYDGQRQHVSARDIEEIETHATKAYHNAAADYHYKQADQHRDQSAHHQEKARIYRQKSAQHSIQAYHSSNRAAAAQHRSKSNQYDVKSMAHADKARIHSAKAASHSAKAGRHAAKARTKRSPLPSPSPGRRGHGYGGHDHIHRGGQQQEVSERDLGELAEEIEARSFDEPVDIDLIIRELGSSDEDGVYF
jgi:hypothetical protein